MVSSDRFSMARKPKQKKPWVPPYLEAFAAEIQEGVTPEGMIQLTLRERETEFGGCELVAPTGTPVYPTLEGVYWDGEYAWATPQAVEISAEVYARHLGWEQTLRAADGGKHGSLKK
jgi:hypothetical protein